MDLLPSSSFLRTLRKPVEVLSSNADTCIQMRSATPKVRCLNKKVPILWACTVAQESL